MSSPLIPEPGHRVVDRPALRAATVRHLGPYERIGETFTRLDALDLQLAPDATLIAIYYDNPRTTPPADLRSDAGIVLTGATPLPPGLTEVGLPAGRYAWTRHLGAYAGLPAAWARLREWLPQDGRQRRAGASYEIYLNTPGNTPPAGLITDIYIPVT